jgi:PAS domain S-box-containing protein
MQQTAHTSTDSELLALLLTHLSDTAVFTLDKHSRVASWNAGAEQFFNRPADAILGHDVATLFEGDAITADEKEVRARRNGFLFPALVRCVPLSGGSAILCRDLTSTRRTEEALRGSELRFAGFMRHLPGLAWIKDLIGRYLYANEAAEKAFGRSQDELRGQTDHELFPPATATRFHENDRLALESPGGLQTVETLQHPDGSLHHSLVSKFGIPGAGGSTEMIGGVAFDITDRISAEETRRFMAEAGETLASSLDFETTLAAVARLVVPRLAD